MLPGADPVQFATVKDQNAEFAQATTIFTLAARPTTGTADGYRIVINGDDSTGATENFDATGVLTTLYPNTTPYMDEAVGFTVDSTIDFDEFGLTDEEWQACTRLMILDNGTNLDWEMVSVQTMTDNGDGTWTATGILRDLAGTGRRSFAIGKRAWLLPAGVTGATFAERNIDISAYPLPNLSVVFAPFNLVDTGPETTISFTYLYRPETPYPPDRLIGTHVSTDVAISWMPQTRGAGNGLSGDPYASVDSSPVSDTPFEGAWRVQSDDGIDTVVYTPSYSRAGIATPQIYTITSVVGGYMSAGVTITI